MTGRLSKTGSSQQAGPCPKCCVVLPNVKADLLPVVSPTLPALPRDALSVHFLRQAAPTSCDSLSGGNGWQGVDHPGEGAIGEIWGNTRREGVLFLVGLSPINFVPVSGVSLQVGVLSPAIA
ncbi:hypothetical protein FKM82_003468 [Ascaphus truei]